MGHLNRGVVLVFLLLISLFFCSISYALVYESYVDGDFYYDNSTTIVGKWGTRVDAGTSLFYSNAINTTLNISGAIIRSSYINKDFLTFGWISANGYNYYAPYNITLIKLGYPPASSGYLSLNNTVANYGSRILVKYYGSVGNTVILNASQINTTSSNVSMTDTNNDGVYEKIITVNTGSAGYRTLFATISDSLGNTYRTDITMYIDNVAPTGSIIINDNMTYTTSRYVYLTIDFSDDYLIRDCKISIDSDFSDDEFVGCNHQLPFVLNNADGLQRVFVLIRDLASNQIVINDSILCDLASPELNMTYPTPNLAVRGSINVAFIGAESASPQISIDGSSFVPTTTTTFHTINTLLLYDGIHTVLVRDSNNSGLTGYTNLVSFVVDNTNPYIDFDYSKLYQNYYTNSNNISFEVKDLVSGINISTLNVTINGAVSSFNRSKDCISNGNLGYVCSYQEQNFTNQANNIYNVTVKDRSGNSYQTSVQIYSDKTKPAITVNNPTGLKNTKSLLVNVTTNEAATCYYTPYYTGNNNSFDYSLSQLNASMTIHLGTYFANEGSNNLYYKCVDRSGNFNITNMSFNVIAEYVSVINISPSGFINISNPILNISTDRIVTCKYDIIDRDYSLMAYTFSNTNAYIHTQQLQNLTEGVHFYYMRCRETNGLTMTSSVFTYFNVDTRRPFIVLETPLQSDTTNSNMTRFIIYDSQSGVDNSTIRVSISGGSTAFNVNRCYSNAMSGYVCEYNESYPQGAVIITINASDYMRNFVSSSFSFTYDTIKPTISVNTADDWYREKTRVLNITLSESSDCRYSDIVLGNSTFNKMAYAFSGNLQKTSNAIVYNGYNVYYIACADLAGNINTTIINFTADHAVPVVDIINLPNATTINGTYWISYSVVDTFGLSYSCEISIDGYSWNFTASSPYNFNSSKYYDGVHTIQIRCNDSVNNMGYSKVAAINIDNTKESVFILDKYNGINLRGIVTFNVIGPDDMDYVTLIISNSTDTIYTSTDYDAKYSFNVDTSLLQDGPVFVTAEGYDEDEYLIDTDVISVVFDNLAPDIILSISNNTVLSGQYDINISTSDNDILKVTGEYLYGGVWYPLFSDYYSPFGYLWHTNLYHDGTYNLRIIAYDKVNLNKTIIVSNVSVVNNLPFVNITNINGADVLAGIVSVNFIASHSFPITTEISVDWGTFVPTTSASNHNLNTGLFQDGQHLIIIKAYDNYGNINYDTVLVTFLNVEQSVYFIEPNYRNKQSKTINLEVVASSYAKKVKFDLIYPAGTVENLFNDTTPRDGFNFLLDTSLYPDSWYYLNATAYDMNNAVLASDAINVTFDNSINFTPDCDIYLIEKARLAITGDSDLEYVLYEYYAGDGIYNIIGRAYTYPYQIYWYGNNVLNGNYSVRITGFDGANTLVKNTSVVVKKLSFALSVNKTYVKNNDSITFYYQSRGLNYNVSIDAITFDSNGYRFYLNDDGDLANGDLYANDGTYSGVYKLSDNNTYADGLYNASAVIKSGGQYYNSTASFYLDNTLPNASFVINNNDNFTYAPSKAMSVLVVLTSNFSDNYGIDACRFMNMYETFGSWESCVYAKSYLLPSISKDGANNRTVYMEVRDYAGNIRRVSDQIFINFSDFDAALNDSTPPNAPEIIIPNYTKSEFTAKWSGSIDRESFILLYKLRYCYTIGINNASSTESILSTIWPDYGCGAGYRLSGHFGSDEYVDFDANSVGITFNDTTKYYFKVKVINGIGLMNYSVSHFFYVDDIAPNAPDITFPVNTFSSYNITYVNGKSLYFNYSATDNVAIAGYYVLLDKNINSIPYSISPIQTNITYSEIISGKWYFHAAAIDLAGNLGNVTTVNISVDYDLPSAPQLLTQTSESAQNISLYWTNSTDISTGIEYYIVEMDDNNTFDTPEFILNTTSNNLLIINNETKTYYVRIKAVDMVNLSSYYSNYGSRVVDTTPPSIVSMKKQGFVVNYDVAFSMKTDEIATCYFKKSNDCSDSPVEPYILEFSYTGGIYHGQLLLINQTAGSSQFCFKCKDAVGNVYVASSPVSFTKIDSPNSMTVSVLNNGTIYIGSAVFLNISLQRTGTGVGEMQKERFVFALFDSASGDEEVIDEFSVDDLGDGEYIVSFYVPQKTGSYDLLARVDDMNRNASLTISDLNMDIHYLANSVLSDTQNSMSSSQTKGFGLTYATSSDNVIGIATESVPQSVSSSNDNLTLSSRISESYYSYIFIAATNRNIQSKIPLLKEKTFENDIAPSFGTAKKLDETDVRAKIEFPDYILVGVNEIQDGSYELLIRKIGNDERTGKPIIEVSVN